MLKHKHHIIPKHMGGSNDPSNIVSLTIEEHTEAHKVLWEKHGKKEDFIAWKMLSGKTEEAEEARICIAKDGFQSFLKSDKCSSWKSNISSSLQGKTQTKQTRNKRSDTMKKSYADGSRKPSVIDPTILRKNYNGEALAEGRRNSTKWKESVTSDAYKQKKAESDPRSREVVVNNVSYCSIRLASRRLGVPYSRLHKLLDGKNILTLPNI